MFNLYQRNAPSMISKRFFSQTFLTENWALHQRLHCLDLLQMFVTKRVKSILITSSYTQDLFKYSNFFTWNRGHSRTLRFIVYCHNSIISISVCKLVIQSISWHWYEAACSKQTRPVTRSKRIAIYSSAKYGIVTFLWSRNWYEN